MNEKKNIFVRIKNGFVNLVKNIWQLGLDTIIGILLLIPSLVFLVRFLDYGYYSTLREIWISSAYGAECIKAVLLFYGLLALAGAYLIKGSFNKKR